MKKLGLFAAMATAFLCGQTTSVRAANANTNSLLVTIQISGIIQEENIVTNRGNTTTTYTTTPAKLASTDILKMIQTEFATNFPTGAQLGYDLEQSGFVVLDKNQNLIMPVGSNPSDSAYGFSLSNNVTGAGSPMVETGRAVDNVSTTNDTMTLTLAAPDAGIFYTDSHGNNFHFDGMLIVRANEVVGPSDINTYSTASILITGSGGGQFFDSAAGETETGVFTSAKFSASGKDLVQ